MKKIDTSNVTSTSRQPFLGRSITHMTEGITENDDSIIQGILSGMNISYTSNDVIILYGCVNSGSNSGAGNPYTVSAGAVYYNGEVYQVDAASGVISGSNVVIGTLTTTYQTGDPVTMTDGATKNVHQIRKFVISQGTSGTGTKDFSDFGTIKRQYSLTTNATQNTTSSTFQDVTGLTYTTPDDGLTRLWLIIFKGYSTCTVSSGDGQGCQIYNSTAASVLDSVEVFQDETANTLDQRIPFTCVYIGLLSPNVQIKARFNSLAGGGVNTVQNKLICVQL